MGHRLSQTTECTRGGQGPGTGAGLVMGDPWGAIPLREAQIGFCSCSSFRAKMTFREGFQEEEARLELRPMCRMKLGKKRHSRQVLQVMRKPT